MMPAPASVAASTVSSNSTQPAKVTTGSCRKLIGVSADTSPSFSARVHSSWPTVPITPVASSHSHSIPTGQRHTNSDGSSDIGTHSA